MTWRTASGYGSGRGTVTSCRFFTFMQRPARMPGRDWAARTGILGCMQHDRPEPEEVFDHELTNVLQAEGKALEAKSEALLATGVASITRPGLVLHARLRVSRWRRGLLEITAEDPVSGEVRGSSSTVLSQTGRNRASLVGEITINLGLEIAHGLGSGGVR